MSDNPLEGKPLRYLIGASDEDLLEQGITLRNAGVGMTTKIIDTNNIVTNHLAQLKADGIETVIRYISTASGEKRIEPKEAHAIAAAGLNLGLVFEVWGGADNFRHHDINAESGGRHGGFARSWAINVGAPDGTIIWFAIDTDCNASQYENLVRPYLAAARKMIEPKFRIGVYACGYVCQQVIDHSLVDGTWLTQSMGFNGSKAFRDSKGWTLLQGPEVPQHGLSIDSNTAGADDYGQFIPFAGARPTPHTTGPAPGGDGPSSSSSDGDSTSPSSTEPSGDAGTTSRGSSERKIKLQETGTMSTFGGPDDRGVGPNEGLALYDNDAQRMADTLGGDWVLPSSRAHGAHGLARRINPDKPYLAFRLPQGSYEFYRNAIAWVSISDLRPELSPIAARFVDWGPNERTGRIADLSPGLARDLGLETDDICTVTVYEDGK